MRLIKACLLFVSSLLNFCVFAVVSIESPAEASFLSYNPDLGKYEIQAEIFKSNRYTKSEMKKKLKVAILDEAQSLCHLRNNSLKISQNNVVFTKVNAKDVEKNKLKLNGAVTCLSRDN